MTTRRPRRRVFRRERRGWGRPHGPTRRSSRDQRREAAGDLHVPLEQDAAGGVAVAEDDPERVRVLAEILDLDEERDAGTPSTVARPVMLAREPAIVSESIPVDVTFRSAALSLNVSFPAGAACPVT